MKAWFRLSTCREAGLAALLVATATACLVVHPRSAAAQACCASAGLIAPMRLRSYEDLAVGMEGRGRSVFGAFDAAGTYDGAQAGESEWSLEQHLFAAMRLFDRGQIAALVPFIETRRTLSGVAASGGGVGDVAVSARYDFIEAGAHRILPGVALLLGVLAPTGTPPERATDRWAAGATGKGSWEGTLGIGLEQGFEPYFITLNALVTLRTSREVMGVNESFAPRFAGIIAVGRVLPHLTTLGLFASALRQGENRDGSGSIPGSGSSLLTVGLASTVSPTDQWRFQGTLFGNVPGGGWGRNETAGAGASLSVIRLWP